jgi:hypothetical protein
LEGFSGVGLLYTISQDDATNLTKPLPVNKQFFWKHVDLQKRTTESIAAVRMLNHSNNVLQKLNHIERKWPVH